MRRLMTIFCMLVGMQAASHAEAVHYDRIHLSASAEQKVENDTLILALYAQEQGREIVPLTRVVNDNIRWALDIVRKDGRFHVQTGSYATRPIYSNTHKVTGWRVRQGLNLEGTDIEQVSGLLGTLQQRLAIQSMRFSVSAQLRERTEDAQAAKALAAFQHRAEQVAQQLGRKGYRIVEIILAPSDASPPYQPEARMAMMESTSGPAIASGNQVIRVTASGIIELEPGP